MATTIFRDIYGLKGMSFLKVFQTKKEFVDFTANEMVNCTGIFQTWRNYVLSKLKQDGCGFVKANPKIQS